MLNDRQNRFIQEYLVDLNATQAAIRAGYSPRTAGRIGHENLKKPEIQVALQKRKKEMSVRARIDADEVVETLSQLAHFTPTDEPRWADKLAAIDRLVKYLGLFEKDNSDDRDPEKAVDRAYSNLEVRLQRFPEELDRLAAIFHRHPVIWRQLAVLVANENE